MLEQVQFGTIFKIAFAASKSVLVGPDSGLVRLQNGNKNNHW